MCICIYIYIIYTPNSGLPDAVFVFGREHGRFNQEHESAVSGGEQGEHEGSTREHAAALGSA